MKGVFYCIPYEDVSLIFTEKELARARARSLNLVMDLTDLKFPVNKYQLTEDLKRKLEGARFK